MEKRNSEKKQVCGNECQFFFLLVDFDFRADIMTKYTFNQIRCFFTFRIDFRFHGLMGYTSKIHE